MQSASHIVRQVLAQQSLSAPPACLSYAPAVLSLSRLPLLSAGVARYAANPAPKDVDEAHQASSATAAAGTDTQQEQQQDSRQHEASSSGSTSSTAASEEATTSSSSSNGSSSSSSFGGFKQHFDSFKSRVGGSSSSSGGEGEQQQQQESFPERASRLLETIKREVADAVLPRREGYSLTRQYDGPRYEAPDVEYQGPTSLAAVKQPETPYSKLLKELHDRFGHHPLFAKLRGVNLTNNPVSKKASELADDLREKYETSDHPAVHKVEDVKEKLFGMTETAAAMTRIRTKDPRFDMSKLLDGVRHDAPTVVKAFLEHDMNTLKQHIGKELEERMSGMFKFFEAAGTFEDPTILFVGEPELVELKLVDDEPMVVVQFACQQIKCTRDKFGNVVDGDSNTIQRVFYFWGLQQEEAGVVLPDGRVLPPRWFIRDMLWQAHLALL